MNKTHLSILCTAILTLTLAFPSSLLAENSEKKPDDDEVNPLENADINIITREDKTIEVHSVNGLVYKVKITPKNAPAYYLYDTDGDGIMDTHSTREIAETTVQQWKIFTW
jgi:hypothetical protein